MIVVWWISVVVGVRGWRPAVVWVMRELGSPVAFRLVVFLLLWFLEAPPLGFRVDRFSLGHGSFPDGGFRRDRRRSSTSRVFSVKDGRGRGGLLEVTLGSLTDSEITLCHKKFPSHSFSVSRRSVHRRLS